MKAVSHILLSLPVIALFLFAGCDDGHVDDPVRGQSSNSYTVQITGTFRSLNSWSGKYSVAVACFDDESAYSLTQATLPLAFEGTEQVLTLTNVPAEAKTIEIAVVNTLRERIATIQSYEIPDNQRFADTIKLNVGELNVGMYAAINQFVFQGNNCSRCHGNTSPAANLDLSVENAYKNLVGIQAAKDASYTRVVPGDAQASFLYKVITEGDPSVGYSHPALFASEAYAPFLQIIKDWINTGAKE